MRTTFLKVPFIIYDNSTESSLYNCFLTVEDYTKETEEISCGQLPTLQTS